MDTEINYDYWKRKYKDEWKAGSKREFYVRDLLRERFPQLSVEFTGYGAGKEKWLKLAPHEKGEPDITVSLNGKVLCFVEVTGSYIVKETPNDIWIRSDKFNRALRVRDRAQTWFYVVYTDRDFALDVETITPFKDNIRTRYPKRECMDCGKIFRPARRCPNCGSSNIIRIPERYIHIPWEEAYPKEKLFEWVLSRLKKV